MEIYKTKNNILKRFLSFLLAIIMMTTLFCFSSNADDTLILIYPGITAGQLLEKIKGNVNVYDSNKAIVSKNELLCTGMQVILTGQGGNELDKKTIIVLGDVNSDGKITMADVEKGLRSRTSLEKFNFNELTAADLDGDKMLTVSDVRCMLRVCEKIDKIESYFAKIK